MLIFPLFLVYEVGVLFTGNVNGADVVTRSVYGALGRPTYLLVHAAVAVGFLLWVRHTRRWTTLRLEIVAPVVLEAAVYALTLGALGTLVVDRILGLGITDGSGSWFEGSWFESMINALGAGVHEELVFRIGVFGGLVALASRAGSRSSLLPPRVVVVLALAVSAVAFSAAHHAGAHGEPFTTHAFAFRCLAGIVFGLVFWFRSLAHAVYAHALYDLVVYARG